MDLNEAGIKVVKINDKKSAKSFGILSSPGLTYFKGGKGDNFEGELTDGEALMDFLGMVSHKMFLITIFGQKHFRQEHYEKF